MPAYSETNTNGMRKRVPLSEATIELFPEHTPVLTAIKKKSGCKTTSPDGNSSKVEWFFKGFNAPEIRGVHDTEDFDGSVEAQDNESNKDNLEGRIFLMRTGVQTGRITNAVTQQHGTTAKTIHLDHKMDALRQFKESQEKWLVSETDGRPETNSNPKAPYMSRAFASWRRKTEVHADLPIPDAARTPDGQMLNIAAESDMKISDLNAMLASCWNARRTGGNWHMFGTTGMQSVVDTWLEFGEQSTTKLPLRRVNQDSGNRTIDLRVKSMSSTFGSVHFSLHAMLPKPVVLAGCGTTNGSKTVTVTTNKFLYPGMPVVGTGIAAGTRIAAVPSKQTSMTTIYLDTNATATGTVSLTFGEEVFSELWDFDFAMLGFIDEVGWQDLENKGGGERGYTDSLAFYADQNPQAHAIIRKSQSGFNGVA